MLVGEQSLPEPFRVEVQRRRSEDPVQEQLHRILMRGPLQRYVYSKSLLLKKRADLRGSVLALPDTPISRNWGDMIAITAAPAARWEIGIVSPSFQVSDPLTPC